MSRILNKDEVELLLNLSLSAESDWHIIVGSPDSELKKRVDSLLVNESVILENIDNGSDILVGAAFKVPDLLIIDEDLEDISCHKIVESIRKIPALDSIKILCAINETINNQSPDWGADDYFIKYNMDKIYLTKKINSILYSSDPEDKTIDKHIFTRKWPRINLGVYADVEIFEPKNPEMIASGEAKVLNISHNGALLTALNLKNGTVPSQSAYLKLHISEGPLKDLEAESVVVRLKAGKDTGIKFTRISKKDRLRINLLFDE